MKTVYTMGIDVGSAASKCVIALNGGGIAGKALIGFGAGTSGPARAMDEALKEAGLEKSGITFILATGYGRNLIGDANLTMSELSCHAFGAFHIFPETRTVIDIGGQDCKVLRLDERGVLESFVMNEKCAAGTGRFLEVMARVLEVDINDMAKLAEESTRRLEISSTCTVFAESEVISHLASGKDKRDIINGVHRSVASRVAGLAKRAGIQPAIVMTGGVAQNHDVRRALETELGRQILTSPLAQYAGALGAALLGYQKISQS